MMLFKVISAIVNNKPINIYNNEKLYHDFTYVDDLIYSIKSLINIISSNNKNISNLDSLSPVAPYRVVNISNSNKFKLLDFIEIIKKNLSKNAIWNYRLIQKGDLYTIWADTSL